MKIDSISPSGLTKDLAKITSGAEEEVGGKSFKQFLSGSIDEVNQLLQTADKTSADIATGKSENLHEAMVSFEKAETAMKMLMQVRNRALDAYHEIMRMQV